MPSWVVDLLLVEAGVFLLLMAGCFVAGMCLEANEQRLERLAMEISEMSDSELRSEMFNYYSKYPTDLVFKEMRERRLRQAAKSACRASVRLHGDMMADWSSGSSDDLRKQIAAIKARINTGFYETTTYIDNCVITTSAAGCVKDNGHYQ